MAVNKGNVEMTAPGSYQNGAGYSMDDKRDYEVEE